MFVVDFVVEFVVEPPFAGTLPEGRAFSDCVSSSFWVRSFIPALPVSSKQQQHMKPTISFHLVMSVSLTRTHSHGIPTWRLSRRQGDCRRPRLVQRRLTRNDEGMINESKTRPRSHRQTIILRLY